MINIYTKGIRAMKMKFSSKVVLYRMVLDVTAVFIAGAFVGLADSYATSGGVRLLVLIFAAVFLLGGIVITNMLMDIYIKIMQDKNG